MKNYSGSDLSDGFKDFFRKEKRRISTKLRKLGCTNIQMSYGFYYFSGFFTSATGQVYYLCSLDTRYNDYRMFYRTAKDYKDYTGGQNVWLNIKTLNFELI